MKNMQRLSNGISSLVSNHPVQNEYKILSSTTLMWVLIFGELNAKSNSFLLNIDRKFQTIHQISISKKDCSGKSSYLICVTRSGRSVVCFLHIRCYTYDINTLAKNLNWVTGVRNIKELLRESTKKVMNSACRKYWKLHKKLSTLNVNLHGSPDVVLIELDYYIIIHLSLEACTMKMSGVTRH